MLLRPISSLDEPDTLPELSHGVPGVQWNRGGPAPAAAPPAADPDQGESYTLYLGLIFAIALILRLLLLTMGPLSDTTLAYTPQTPLQLELADNLAAHRTFGLAAQPEDSLPRQLDALRAQRGELTTVGETALVPEFYQAPGYPAVLALFRATGLSLNLLLLLQCLAGAACTLLVYWLGRGIIGRKAPAALAAVVVALHPALLVSSATLAGDTLAVALVLLGLAAVAHTTRRDLRSCFGGGLALGAAALLLPVLGWLSPLVAAWMVLSQRRIQSVLLAAAVLLGTALPVGGWIYRNVGHGLPAEISGQLANDRLFGSVAAAQNPLAGPYAPQSRQQLLDEFTTHAQQPAQQDRDTLHLLNQYGREHLNAHRADHLRAVLGPGSKQLGLDHSLDAAYARLGLPYAPAGYAATLLGEPVATAQPDEPVTEWVVNVWVALNALLLLGMALGTAMMLWHRRFAGLLLCLTVTGYFVFYSSAGGGETLRLPLIAVQGLLLAGLFAPAPPRTPRAARAAKPKLRKLEKLDDDPRPGSHSPLPQPPSEAPTAQPDLRRNAAGSSPLWNSRDSDPAPTPATGDPDAPAYMQLVHPSLRQETGGRPI